MLTQKVSVQWLESELNDESLAVELRLDPFELVFARLCMDNPVFVQCKLLDSKVDGEGRMAVQSGQSSTLVGLESIAMGRAPMVRCPVGTRVVALLDRGRLGKG